MRSSQLLTAAHAVLLVALWDGLGVNFRGRRGGDEDEDAKSD